MSEYRNLEFSTLVDLLAQYTIKYLKMHSEGAPQEEFEVCKKAIERLQEEIDLQLKKL